MMLFRKFTMETKILNASLAKLAFKEDSLLTGRFSSTGPADWLAEACHELQQNRCVALPTETVYGLAANALDDRAIQQIYQIKGRPSDNPLIVHVSSLQMLSQLYGARDPWSVIPAVYHSAIRKFWPGPLTLIMPRPASIPLSVLGGHGATVAFRFPAHPVARAIIQKSGLPLAAPSANQSGRPSPTLAQHVYDDLQGKLRLIVDAGACDVGVESTVVDAFSENSQLPDGTLSPCVLRPGGVTPEQLSQLGGPWQTHLRVYHRDFTNPSMEQTPTTPGMKYRHYSPSVPLYLFLNIDKMQEYVDQIDQRRKIGVILLSPNNVTSASDKVDVVQHQMQSTRDLAHHCFRLLRALERASAVDCILVQAVEECEEGLAVMDRLKKASSLIK